MPIKKNALSCYCYFNHYYYFYYYYFFDGESDTSSKQ